MRQVCILTVTLLSMLCTACAPKVEVIDNLKTVPYGELHRFTLQSDFVAERPIDVWVPQGYPKDAPYNVLYMNDGATMFGQTPPDDYSNGEWEVDERISSLMQRGLIEPTIVVGIYNIGKMRSAEYFPQKAIKYIDKSYFRDFLEGVDEDCTADNYLSFIVEEVKPYIDSNYEVDRSKESTFIMGSSMGGLISMYAHCEYPEIFYGSASLSTHFIGIMEHNDEIPNGIFRYMKEALPESSEDNIFYFDRGNVGLDALYPVAQQRADSLMVAMGYNHTNWDSKIFPHNDHTPKTWAQTIQTPLLFLLGKKGAIEE